MKEKLSKKKEKNENSIYILYAVTLAAILLYVIFNNYAIGIFAFVLIIVTVAAEFRSGVKEVGMKKTLVEIVITIVVAFLAVWVLPSLILHSSTPIDVVVSCSMVPVFHRGDIVVLHGIGNMTDFLNKNRIPIISVNETEFSRVSSNISGEMLYPLAYNNTAIAETIPNASKYQTGFFSEPCIVTSRDPYKCLVNNSYQSKNLITYNLSIANVTIGTSHMQTVYTSSITINGIRVNENFSNPVIVYKGVGLYGLREDIIHRLYAAIKVNNTYYLLTKGDNNQVLDLQAGIYPPNNSEVLGYVIGKIPYLGYPSLIIRGQTSSNLLEGCNQTITYPST
ncbi:MAG: hypothetical protein M1122_00280 [Candidatus Marsarchaeota archaeon]|jgi:hypothetical protein|nr:hypothetical protein [Candidatus Marsarchaeota archaeon]